MSLQAVSHHKIAEYAEIIYLTSRAIFFRALGGMIRAGT
jgi:hypothetical protein